MFWVLELFEDIYFDRYTEIFYEGLYPNAIKMVNFRPYIKGRTQGKMWKNSLLYIVVIFIMPGCWSINPDEISDSITWEPNISVPLGKLLIDYDDVYDIPGYPIFPEEPDRPIEYIEKQPLDFDLTDALSKRENIVYMQLRCETINQFPADIKVEVYYKINGTDSVSLTKDQPIIVPAADVDAEGKVIHYERDIADIRLDDEEIDNLENVDQVIIYSTISNLYITEVFENNIQNYSIVSKLGAQAQLIIKTNP